MACMDEFGQYLRARRMPLDLTKHLLARRLGVQPSYVGLIEKGVCRLSLKLIARMADTLCMDRQKLPFAAYPETKELVTEPNGRPSNKTTQSWRSFGRQSTTL